jgi:hypothetical protein
MPWKIAMLKHRHFEREVETIKRSPQKETSSPMKCSLDGLDVLRR